MTGELLFTLTLVSALGSGLMAGVFFAFSTSVMKALDGLSPPVSISAMQSINVIIVNPLFLSIFLGTAAGCLALMIISLMNDETSVYLVLGSTFYLVSFLITAVFNVPKNNFLETIDPNDSDNANLWSSFYSKWTTWNHIRTIASLIASALLTLSLCY